MSFQLRITALAMLLVVAIVIPFWILNRPDRTVQVAIAAPSTFGGASPSPTPAMSSTPTAAPTTPSQPPVTEKAAAQPGCTSYGFATGDTRGGTVSFTGSGRWGSKSYKLCPGETVRVWWVQYRWQPDGSQKLSGSGSSMISYDQPTVSLSWPDFNNNCLSYFALGTGTVSFPASVAAGTTPDPLIRVWREGKGGTTMHGSPNRTDPANC
jgi:hypothetical protein